MLDETLAPNGQEMELDELINKLTERQFRWGVSDGN